MLREGDLPLRLLEGRGYLDYLGPQDEPWLRVLLQEMLRHEGRRARELAERLADPLPCEAPYYKRRATLRAAGSCGTAALACYACYATHSGERAPKESETVTIDMISADDICGSDQKCVCEMRPLEDQCREN